nr:serine hydrolase domain-containing protein [Candidatus Sigynarchaeota archaeon]
MVRVEINGTCDDRFAKVKEVFAKHFETGEDVGASFAVYKDGKSMVDIWAGHADAARTRPWDKDTLVCVFSSTKVMAALCVHVLADRGLIDYDAPVAKYWPEFAQAGKENVLVRHVLSHTSGVATYPEQVTREDFVDWTKMTRLLEHMTPLWQPGTKLGYHMTSFGFLTGEIVRRVTEKSIATFFHDEIAKPLGADFYIGLPVQHHGRLADLIPPKGPGVFDLVNSDFAFKLLGKPVGLAIARNPKIPIANINEMNHMKEWLAAEVPSSNGTGNARSMAKVGAMVACGGELDGVRLLSPAIIKKIATPQFTGKGYLLAKTCMGLGLGINIKKMANGKVPLAIGWSGLGGSYCVMDLDNRMSYAYAMNKMNLAIVGDPRRGRFEKALYESLQAFH